MTSKETSLQAKVPAVDRVLNFPAVAEHIGTFGHDLVREAVRNVLKRLRQRLTENDPAALAQTDAAVISTAVGAELAGLTAPSLRPVFNLTGTVLHTNLGRAPLPEEAVEAMVLAARGATNLEFDLATGRRGDRDSHLEDWLCRLTGGEAATVVNNNAAAVLLVLNTLARRKEVPVSRGELIEIGGAFRIPDIMMRAGCKLIEVGTTNRTHLRDFEDAVGARTALLMKVHTSNYVIQGFTAAPAEKDLAALAHKHAVPFIVDLGSGTLVDLTPYGLPHEPTAGETLAQGADIVTFSGDKLLGGPQAGIIVGRADLIAKIKSNPMKRAMRLDKVTIAALGAVLRLYANPETLVEKIPTLRLLARPAADIEAAVDRVLGHVTGRLASGYRVEKQQCRSEVGSGALPTQTLPSWSVAITPQTPKRRSGAALRALAAAFRMLPIPVIGYIHDNALRLDLRCLGDETAFIDQLALLSLDPPEAS